MKLQVQTVPASITGEVKAFCDSVSGSPPIFVNVSPIRNAAVNECFENVRNHMKRSGGAVVYGWQIWLWPSVFIEAEFHALWEAPDGAYLDITPKPLPVQKILFVPDPGRVYDGRQVNNIRKAIANDELVRDFISVSDKLHEIMNRGKRAFRNGLIRIPEKEIKPLEDRQKNAYDTIAIQVHDAYLTLSLRIWFQK